MSITITKELRSLLVRKGMNKGANSDEARAFLIRTMAAGKIAASDLVPGDTGESERSRDVGQSNIGELTQEFLSAKGYLSEDSKPGDVATAMQNATTDGVLTAKALADFEATKQASGPSAKQMFSGGPNVKAPSTAYKTNKSVGLHVKTNRPVKGFDGSYCETPSESELAKIGAFMKSQAMRDIPGTCLLKEHERALLGEIFSTDRFVGELGGQYSKDWTGTQVKTLYGDNTSGGINAVPYWFDANLVTYPLLYGELLPDVELIDMPRAMEVRGAQMNNPSVSWGPLESAGSISEFDTAGLVAGIDSSVEPLQFSIEIGRDFLADADIVNFGGYVVEQVGKVMLQELDYVVASGDGSTQPKGVANTGINNLVPGMGSGGTLNLSDVENAYFSLPKQYRTPAHRVRWFSSDSAYQAVRALPIGDLDARRLFGMDEGSYSVLNFPWKINQSLAATNFWLGALDRYRMWRRQGQEVRFYNEGKALATANTVLLVIRSRWAGQVIDPNAFVSMGPFNN
ncbi:MAG TPA: phage major capsid protein [Pirellulales bacterium]|nr:phage major capsid protein [Pirellulales bacterium]